MVSIRQEDMWKEESQLRFKLGGYGPVAEAFVNGDLTTDETKIADRMLSTNMILAAIFRLYRAGKL